MSYFTNNIAMSECSHAAYCTFYMFESLDGLWVGGVGWVQYANVKSCLLGKNVKKFFKMLSAEKKRKKKGKKYQDCYALKF